MNKYLERARQMRLQLDNITKDFDDATAIENKELYQDWNGNGIQVTAGDIYLYNDNLYKVVQSHTTQADWTPDKVPALYQIVTVGGDYPEWDSKHGAYAKGAKCSHNGKHWISNVDNNIWEPGATGVYTWDEEKQFQTYYNGEHNITASAISQYGVD